MEIFDRLNRFVATQRLQKRSKKRKKSIKILIMRMESTLSASELECRCPLVKRFEIFSTFFSKHQTKPFPCKAFERLKKVGYRGYFWLNVAIAC